VYSPADATVTSSFPDSLKSRIVLLPFLYWPTQLVMEKRLKIVVVVVVFQYSSKFMDSVVN